MSHSNTPPTARKANRPLAEIMDEIRQMLATVRRYYIEVLHEEPEEFDAIGSLPEGYEKVAANPNFAALLDYRRKAPTWNKQRTRFRYSDRDANGAMFRFNAYPKTPMQIADARELHRMFRWRSWRTIAQLRAMVNEPGPWAIQFPFDGAAIQAVNKKMAKRLLAEGAPNNLSWWEDGLTFDANDVGLFTAAEARKLAIAIDRVIQRRTWDSVVFCEPVLPKYLFKEQFLLELRQSGWAPQIGWQYDVNDLNATFEPATPIAIPDRHPFVHVPDGWLALLTLTSGPGAAQISSQECVTWESSCADCRNKPDANCGCIPKSLRHWKKETYVHVFIRKDESDAFTYMGCAETEAGEYSGKISLRMVMDLEVPAVRSMGIDFAWHGSIEDFSGRRQFKPFRVESAGDISACLKDLARVDEGVLKLRRWGPREICVRVFQTECYFRFFHTDDYLQGEEYFLIDPAFKKRVDPRQLAGEWDEGPIAVRTIFPRKTIEATLRKLLEDEESSSWDERWTPTPYGSNEEIDEKAEELADAPEPNPMARIAKMMTQTVLPKLWLSKKNEYARLNDYDRAAGLPEGYEAVASNPNFEKLQDNTLVHAAWNDDKTEIKLRHYYDGHAHNFVWVPKTDLEWEDIREFERLYFWRSWRTTEELARLVEGPGPWMIRMNTCGRFGAAIRAVVAPGLIAGRSISIDKCRTPAGLTSNIAEMAYFTAEQVMKIVPVLDKILLNNDDEPRRFYEPIAPKDVLKDTRLLHLRTFGWVPQAGEKYDLKDIHATFSPPSPIELSAKHPFFFVPDGWLMLITMSDTHRGTVSFPNEKQMIWESACKECSETRAVAKCGCYPAAMLRQKTQIVVHVFVRKTESDRYTYLGIGEMPPGGYCGTPAFDVMPEINPAQFPQLGLDVSWHALVEDFDQNLKFEPRRVNVIKDAQGCLNELAQVDHGVLRLKRWGPRELCVRVFGEECYFRFAPSPYEADPDYAFLVNQEYTGEPDEEAVLDGSWDDEPIAARTAFPRAAIKEIIRQLLAADGEIPGDSDHWTSMPFKKRDSEKDDTADEDDDDDDDEDEEEEDENTEVVDTDNDDDDDEALDEE